MKKHTTRLFAVLPAALMLLPLTSMDVNAEFSNNEIKACDSVKIASKNSLAGEYVNLNTKENILHNNKFTLKVETDAKNSTRNYFFVGVDKGMRFNAFEEKNDIDLEDVKKKAKEEVDKFENLSQEQRDALKDEINSKTSEKDINKVVKKGKLQDKKIEAKNKVDNLNNLTDKQKADYKHQISIKDNETSVNDELYKAEVQDLKEEYKKNIEKMEFLTREQKEYYKKQIDKETNKIGVNGVYNVASGANDGAKVLKETQEKAKDTIEKLIYLARDKKESYKSDIDNAGSVYGVEQILARAEKEDKKAKEEKDTKEKEEAAKKLQEAKAKAKEEINKLEDLGDEKKSFIDKVELAETEEAVRTITEEAKKEAAEKKAAKEKAEKEKEEAAKKEAEKKLQKAKANALKEINGLDYLVNKEVYKNQITEATEISKVNEILSKAKEENNKTKAAKEKEELEEAKTNARNSIENLTNLDDGQKNKYLEDIEKAKSKDDVNNVLNNAKNADNTAGKDLKEAKRTAKETIEGLENLKNKDSFLENIEKAKNKNEVLKILKEAQDEDRRIKQEELNQRKSVAINEINGLDYLVNKEDYKNQIIEATEISKVNEILDNAKENNKAKAAKEKEELDKAKNAASLEVNSFNDLGDAKDAYKSKIVEVQSKAEVENILLEARAKNFAIIEVKNLEKLDDIKSVYIEKIIEAENKEKVEEIKDEAKAKEVAIEKVEKLDKLKKEDKDKLIKEIKEAESTEAAEKIVKEAEKKVNPKPKDDPKPGKEEANPVNPEKPNKDRQEDKKPEIIFPSRKGDYFRPSGSHSKGHPVKTGAIIMAKENSKESPQNVIDNKLEKKAEDKIVYRDIKGHWAERQINYALEQNYFKDIVKGNEFKPSEKITRAEFVTILGRRAGIDPSTFELKNFKDVDGKKYYSPYIAWALENKIVFGIDEDAFAPDKEMTREEMAAFLVRFEELINLNLKEEKEGKNFKDAKEISTWAKDSVEKLSKLNIIEGMGDGKFSPKTNLTRAQIASVIDKIK